MDLVIVVGMLLTGFDAPGMNTLFVDKNLRFHGLIQAFSRTNRIYDGTKTFGNIVCFRNLENATKEALRLFGQNPTEDPVMTVLERGYKDFLQGYDDERGHHHKGYVEVVQQLEEQFPDPTNLVEEKDKRAFAYLFGQYLRLENVLQNFDEFVQLRELHETIPAGDAEALAEFQQTTGLSDEQLAEMQATEVLTTRRVQDCASVYHDIRVWIKREREEKKASSLTVDWDNVVFEVDLLRSQEINLDYILRLIYDHHQAHGEKEALIEEVRRVIRASLGQRAKELRTTSSTSPSAVAMPLIRARTWTRFCPSRFRLSTAILALSAMRCLNASLPSWRNSLASSMLLRMGYCLVSENVPSRLWGSAPMLV